MKWYQFTSAFSSRKYIFAIETTDKGIETKLYHSLHEMPKDIKMSYITDAVANLQNPLSIEEIAAVRQNMQNIITNRLGKTAR